VNAQTFHLITNVTTQNESTTGKGKPARNDSSNAMEHGINSIGSLKDGKFNYS
jgi:hypothetical protein